MSNSQIPMRPSMLSPENYEVWRVMSELQQAEVSHFATNFLNSWVQFANARVGGGNDLGDISKGPGRALVKEANVLMDTDLIVASGANFPELTRNRALLLGRLSKPIGGILLTGQADRQVSDIGRKCAVALTGLHMSLLGSEELITDENNQEILTNAAQNMHRVAFGTVKRTVATQTSRYPATVRPVRESNMFDHIPRMRRR